MKTETNIWRPWDVYMTAAGEHNGERGQEEARAPGCKCTPGIEGEQLEEFDKYLTYSMK